MAHFSTSAHQYCTPDTARPAHTTAGVRCSVALCCSRCKTVQNIKFSDEDKTMERVRAQQSKVTHRGTLSIQPGRGGGGIESSSIFTLNIGTTSIFEKGTLSLLYRQAFICSLSTKDLVKCFLHTIGLLPSPNKVMFDVHRCRNWRALEDSPTLAVILPPLPTPPRLHH